MHYTNNNESVPWQAACDACDWLTLHTTYAAAGEAARAHGNDCEDASTTVTLAEGAGMTSDLGHISKDPNSLAVEGGTVTRGSATRSTAMYGGNGSSQGERS